MSQPFTQQVLDAVNEREIIALAQELVRCPSVNPPGAERQAAERLAQFLEGAGMDVELRDVEPGRPNVIATLDCGDGPTLLFNGHLDVVPPGEGWTVDPFGGAVKDGKLYGRGACDMKGPLAAVAGACAAVRRAAVPLHGSIVLTAVAGEEVDQCGTRQLVADGVEADCAICAEPTRLVPIVAHKGEVYFDVTIRGRAAHGAAPEHGINAIAKATPVITEMLALAERLRSQVHALCGHPTINIGTIHGGTVTSTVPDRCTISLDRRLLPGESFEQARADVEGVLSAISQRDPQFQYEIDVPLTCQPMEIAAGEPIVGSLRRQVAKLTGNDPGIGGWSAACDATLLTNDAGIPTCIFGPGDLETQAHKPDESIDLAELVLGAKVYASTIADLLASDAASRHRAERPG